MAGCACTTAISQPPRPAGRGQRPRPSPVQAYAEDKGLAVSTPASLNKDLDAQEAFAALELDAAVVAAYGLILPKRVLEAPRLGCVNIHASLLPRWRGAAPIHRAILAGDRRSGVTIMMVDEGLDSGPVLLSRMVRITSRTTAGSLHDELAMLGCDLVLEALEGLARGRLRPESQPDAGATYAPKLSRNDGRLDWRRPAGELERAVRALDPWPGAWFSHAGETIKVLAAELVGAREGATPGTLLDTRLTVACGAGALRVLRLQRAGKQAMTAPEFLRGHPLDPGTVLD